MEVVATLLAGLLIAGVGGRALLLRRRECRALRRLATVHRLNFSPDDLIGIHDRYYNLQLVRQGHSRHVSQVLHGSSEVGLLTLFRYACDTGFGVHRASRQWWFAVVETADAHKPWCAVPGDTARPSNAVSVGRFWLCADHEATRTRLTETGVEPVLASVPSRCHWEVRGPLVAVAAPPDIGLDGLDQLLRAVRDLAGLLNRTDSPE